VYEGTYLLRARHAVKFCKKMARRVCSSVLGTFSTEQNKTNFYRQKHDTKCFSTRKMDKKKLFLTISLSYNINRFSKYLAEQQLG
jgi:hypothetical protein